MAIPPAVPNVPNVLRLHHVGVVVRDAEAAAEDYRQGLGLDVLAVEDYRGAARVAILGMGEAMLHLIQPLRDDTPWAAALRERGEGPHHVAFEVADLREAIDALTASGIGLLDPSPSREAGGLMSVFIDPAATGGTLIELGQQIRV